MRIPPDILFKKQLFAIETSIRKMLYPVAENQYPTIAGNHKVEQNMTMPENKKVDMRRGIFSPIFFGISNQKLIFFSLIGKVITMLTTMR